MEHITNPYRGPGLDHPDLTDIPLPSGDATRTQTLLAHCPRAAPTPLISCETLADIAGVRALWVKDERPRMGLGSFKALGAANVIAHDAAAGRARGRTYIAASAGNHGLSVAAGAAAFGAQSHIYLADTVPESFAERLRAEGATVIRAGAIYEQSMAAATAAAARGEGTLLSDSSWQGYTEAPHLLMEGYTVLMAEALSRMPQPPTHILLQAGVGGLAAAAAATARRLLGDGPKIAVVEPQAAPALFASIKAGRPVASTGPVSIMGRLDCKEPSLIALKGLARDADLFITLTEHEAISGTEAAARHKVASTPSGAAGIAALLAMTGAARRGFGLDGRSCVLAILSEEPEP